MILDAFIVLPYAVQKYHIAPKFWKIPNKYFWLQL